jgi:predicted NBD/HSP70 family sugar kinase
MTRPVPERSAERPASAGESARSVVLAVLRSGPVSRAELARRLGLSTASLTRLTRPMLSNGLLVEHRAESASRTGRPARPLDIAAGQAYFIGIKITRDTMYTVLSDLKGAVTDRSSRPITDRSTEAVIDLITAGIAERRADRPGIAGVGIGIGGAVEGNRIVRHVPALGWDEIELADEIGARTGLPVSVDNDVRALAQGEHWFGPGRGCSSLAVITVGVGVGCAVVVDDQLVEGRRGLAAQIDHWTLDPDGPSCVHGHRGCADTLLTSGRISARATEALHRPVSFEQCVALAAAGDPTATTIIADAADHLGLLTARVADLLAPERILITGDGIDFVLQAEDRLRAALTRHRSYLADADEVRLSRSDFFDWARGAAAVAIRRHVLTGLPVT